MINYIHTDLACETNTAYCDFAKDESAKKNSILDKETIYSSDKIGGFAIRRMKNKNDDAIENYSTIYFDNCTSLSAEDQRLLSLLIAHEINLISKDSYKEFLICGLGNKNMTSDSIGPKVTGNILVSRHISRYDKETFKLLNTKAVSAISAGVLSQTGIESADIIKALCEQISPDVVIVVDALCARSNERLCKTVQITDTGVSPGSGVNNKRPTVNSSLLGIPVTLLLF